MHRQRPRSLASAAALTFALLPIPTSAQGPTFVESFHVVAPGGQVGNRCARAFADVLNQSEAFIERSSSEETRLVSDCVGDISSPSFTAECDIAIANSAVDYVVLVAAEEVDDAWVFEARVQSPVRAGGVWSDTAFVEERSGVRAALDGCARLGDGFLARGVTRAPVGPAGDPTTGAPAGAGGPAVPPAPRVGVIEVLQTTPTLVSVWIDGEEVGVSNQQLPVTPGRRRVELRAPGYERHTETVEVDAGDVEALRGVTLTPLPASLEVSCNIAGAEIVVDGRVVETTAFGAPVSVSVSASAGRIAVRREGYVAWVSTLSLTPGGSTRVEAELEVVPVVEPPTPRPTATSGTGHGGSTSGAPSGFVRIEPGTFTMGSPSSEEGRFEGETQHTVTLTRAFWLQSTEVTQGQWRALMGNNPSRFSSCGDDCPVEQVNWWEAAAYTNALSRSEGLAECYTLSGCGSVSPGEDMECRSVTVNAPGSVPYACEGYRLPTESEWEYAARGGTTSARHGDLDDVAWHSGNSNSRTHEVGTRRANAWGLHDMLGNAWEWTWDRYASSYPSGSVRDPLGPDEGSYRVRRGGSWYDVARFVRAASRNSGGPAVRYYAFLGFRPARSVTQ